MSRLSFWICFLAILAVSFAGCSKEGNPISADHQNRDGLSAPGVTGSLGEFRGLCTLFQISGTVYVDADSSGTMGEDESGIADVTVTLLDSIGNIQMVSVDENGFYVFFESAGTYTVRIDAATEDDDFNETLTASFDPTGPTSLVVTVGDESRPDSPGNDFGFDPRSREIISDFDEGILVSTGKPPKFWIKELRAAIKHDRCNKGYGAATLTQFLMEIQGLYLPEPFQFTPGNELQEALDILTARPRRNSLVKLRRELLAAELNHVSGRGIVNGAEFQGVLISWAESVYLDAAGMPIYPEGVKIVQAVAPPLEEAVGVLSRVNCSTGGGSGGGG